MSLSLSLSLSLSVSAMLRAALPRAGPLVFKRSFSTKTISRQVYAIPTYDAIFKRVLSDDEVRSSFLSTFLPKGIKVESSKVLDPGMNPFESFQLLRDFISDDATKDLVAKLKDFPGLHVSTSGSTKRALDEKATDFLKEIISRYDEILLAFPKPQYNGTMDLVCKLSTEEYALVEMQVVNQTFWDGRALAYAAAFYGNQLLRGQEWKDLRKVIGINILGGSRADEVYWKDSPQEYVRHYRFQEQLHEPSRYIDGIQLIQYSIGHAPIDDINLPQALRDWCTFFKKAHRMTGEEVGEKILTNEVRKAFETIEFRRLPAEVKSAYEAEGTMYSRYHTQIEEEVTAAREEERAKAAAVLQEERAKAAAAVAAALEEERAKVAAGRTGESQGSSRVGGTKGEDESHHA